MLVAASSCNSSATHKKMKISHITRRLRLSGFRMSTRPTHFQPSSDWLVMMLMMLVMMLMMLVKLMMLMMLVTIMLLSDDRMNGQLQPSVLDELYYLLLITSPVHLTQEAAAKKWPALHTCSTVRCCSSLNASAPSEELVTKAVSTLVSS